MLVVIPISKTDENLSYSFCRIMNFFGPYLNHEVLFTYKKSDQKLVDEVKQKISCLFKNSSDCIVDENVKVGWPQGPNAYWKRTILHLRNIKNKSPWYWMELDVTPLKDKWLDELEKDYLDAGFPFFGVVAESSHYYPFHLSGCAIYPPDISNYTNNWKWVHNSSVAFDLICSAEIMEYYVFDSLKMINYFKTEKYKFEGGDFSLEKIHIMFDTGRQKDIEKRPIFLGFSVLLHGCKDGSLAEEVMKHYDYIVKDLV
jgi:hypothetical protein